MVHRWFTDFGFGEPWTSIAAGGYVVHAGESGRGRAAQPGCRDLALDRAAGSSARAAEGSHANAHVFPPWPPERSSATATSGARSVS